MRTASKRFIADPRLGLSLCTEGFDQSSDASVVVRAGYIGGGVAIGVSGIAICPRLEEDPHRVLLAEGAGEMERCTAAFVLCVDSRPPDEEQIYHLAMATTGGQMQCSHSVIVLGIRVRSVGQQQPNRLHLTFLSCVVEGGRTAAILGIHIGSLGKKKLNDCGTPVSGCLMKCGFSPLALCPN
jgi:hypothetical protein